MADDVQKVTGDGGQQPDSETIETTEEAIEAAEETPEATEATDAGDAGDAGDDGEKKPKTTKAAFNMTDAKYCNDDGEIVSAINADGKLIAVPKLIKDPDNADNLIYEGWNIKKHVPLKKAAFADEIQFIFYQAFVSRVKAAILVKSAETKERRAKQLQQFGSETARKKVKKIVAMREAMELLQKELEDSGVDLSSLVEDVK